MYKKASSIHSYNHTTMINNTKTYLQQYHIITQMQGNRTSQISNNIQIKQKQKQTKWHNNTNYKTYYKTQNENTKICMYNETIQKYTRII